MIRVLYFQIRHKIVIKMLETSSTIAIHSVEQSIIIFNISYITDGII